MVIRLGFEMEGKALGALPGSTAWQGCSRACRQDGGRRAFSYDAKGRRSNLISSATMLRYRGANAVAGRKL